MDNPAGKQKSLGQAIDELIQALEPLDESSRQTAIRAACEHLKIGLPAAEGTGASSQQASASPGGQDAAQILRVPNIKSLKEEKQPSSANEMAALVAYYLSELAPPKERQAHVTFEDMVKFFKPLYPLPKAPRQLLPNAKNAGYFDSLGDGKYRLNPVGYNLVVHNLPRTGTESRPVKPRKARKPVDKKSRRRH